MITKGDNISGRTEKKLLKAEIVEGRLKKTPERNTLIKEEAYRVLSRRWRCWPNNVVIPVLILPTRERTILSSFGLAHRILSGLLWDTWERAHEHATKSRHIITERLLHF